ncbi:MAG: UxaA family hydrolase [Promethearchaeota archaeon]
MSGLKNNFIIMHLDDNSATALIDISKNTELRINEIFIKINHNIPMGHKIALEDIKKGELVKKYGHSIGITTEEIKRGDWIHTHNLTSQYLKEVVKV